MVACPRLYPRNHGGFRLLSVVILSVQSAYIFASIGRLRSIQEGELIGVEYVFVDSESAQIWNRAPRLR
jgi:hypothetical protein